MPRETQSFEADVARSVEDWIHTYIPAVAERMGPLPDSVGPTHAELQQRWDLRADTVPPEMVPALAQQAAQVISQEHQQQGKPPPDPETLVKLVAARVNSVIYPWRDKVYGNGAPKPEQKVKQARRFSKPEPPTAPTPPAAPQQPGLPQTPLSPPDALTTPPAAIPGALSPAAGLSAPEIGSQPMPEGY